MARSITAQSSTSSELVGRLIADGQVGRWRDSLAEEASLSAESALLSAAASAAVVRGLAGGGRAVRGGGGRGRAVGGRGRGRAVAVPAAVTLALAAEVAEGALEVFLHSMGS